MGLRTTALAALLAAPAILAAVGPAPAVGAAGPGGAAQEAWFFNKVDHEQPRDERLFAQRYFINDEHWGGPGAPIFFYTGNEADVELYVNATGLMWEHARDFRACLLFAEHRYYGQTQIDGNKNYDYLTHSQALHDFAALLTSFRHNNSAHDSPAIAFGGSYGGMLTAWFRFRFPKVVQGALAGSAPIFAFQGDGFDFFKDGGNAYWRVVTKTAGPECAAVVRPAFKDVFALAGGLVELQETFGLCKVPRSALDVALWVANAFDTLAMGQFPFRSNYLTGKPEVFLPPFPMRAACNAALGGPAGLAALARATQVFYNASQAERCFEVADTSESGDDRFSGTLWMMQWCREALPEEFYFSMTGQSDMFFPYNQPFDEGQVTERCRRVWNVTRSASTIAELYGSPKHFLDHASRIIFSNGGFDPWRSGGVLSLTPAQAQRDLHIVDIPNGAHHVDLMFADPNETPDITAARKYELGVLRRWLAERDTLAIE